ncbi:MAG: carboxypeptidase regulatory-like domain-containing protein, partial [Deltaproteobacteria bacterium]|nr:carboxypeptidase regulatory-like domain-containing protein [Deltaproteobacteria bacterium]
MGKIVFLVGLLCIWSIAATLAAGASSLGRVTGQLQSAEVDSCRGIVSLWPATERGAAALESFNSVPPWVAEIAPDCSFVIEAEPGSYYLRGVLRTTAGSDWGPLRPGDLVFMSPDGAGQRLQVEVNADLPVAVGTQSSHWEFSGFPAQIETGVTGRLVDSAKKPVAGLLVEAFGGPSMANRPLAVSAPSDADGRFQLRLAAPETIYLQGRETVGIGFPPLGSLFGIYGGKKAQAVTVKQGERIDNLEIIIGRRTAEPAVK